VQQPKGLPGAPVYRHFTAKEAGADGRDQNPQLTFHGRGALLVHFYKVGTSLAEILFHLLIAQLENAKDYHMGHMYGMPRVRFSDERKISDNRRPFFERPT
jgi:hypothetical protein